MTITRAVNTGAHNNAASSTTTCVMTLASLTAGNCVVIGAGWVDVSGTVTCTVADDKGNTYTAVGSKSRNATQQYSVQLFRAYNVAASAGTVTITATITTAAGFSDIKGEQISSSNGSFTSDPLNAGYGSKVGTGNSTALSTASGTPDQDNTAIFTYGGANSGTITAGTGFTLRTTGADGLGLADLVQTTAAAKQGLLTTSSSSQWTICACAINDVAAAGASDTGGFLMFF
jgi:hypothetical protein